MHYDGNIHVSLMYYGCIGSCAPHLCFPPYSSHHLFGAQPIRVSSFGHQPPVLISFLIDLVSNQSGFFLKDWESFEGQDVVAKKILAIGTGGAGDEPFNSLGSDSRVKKLNVSEFGSFHGLAAAILAEV